MNERPAPLGFPRGPLASTRRQPSHIEEKVEAYRRNETEQVVRRDVDWRPINLSGGFRERDLALSSLVTDTFNGRAFGLVYQVEGSDPGGRLNFDFGAGGRLTNQPPGLMLPVQFDALEISRGSRSVSGGDNARILYLVTEQAAAAYFYSNPNPLSGGNARGGAVGPSGAVTQARNTAADGANIPVLATDGMSLVGLNGFRVIIQTTLAVQTLVSGSIRYWYYDDDIAVWMLVGVQALNIADGVGYTRWAFSEELAPTGYGRIYPEVVLGNSSGANNDSFTVYVRGAS